MNKSALIKSESTSRKNENRRPVWIVLFAAILILTAGVSSAQTVDDAESDAPTSDAPTQSEPKTVAVEYDGVIHQLPAASGERQVAEPANQPRDQNQRPPAGRPKYVKVLATLANWDADSDPDGWSVEVALLDANDRLVVKRSHAAFELMPRIAAAHAVGYVDAQKSPVRWSSKLKFDDDNIARVKLPMREKLRPLFDQHAVFFPDPGLGSTVADSRGVVLRRPLSNHRMAHSRDWRANVGRPDLGEFKARISVPTEGVFEATVPVQIRPSVLVDTKWPYR